MSNVIPFRPRPKPVSSTCTAGASLPNPARGPDESRVYLLSDVLLAVAWASYTGKIALARKLTSVVSASNFSWGIDLSPELEQVINMADLELGLRGPEEV